ncbi:unnamed protein product [Chironomus riparius]|uniref:N-acetyltransferase domain-containing protein n=1 Tax=Chironomus riparius TaxID=315576 RepID=A0A9N9WM11_9DIPT|nr:unnamed protein product [Chironomus riparius]
MATRFWKRPENLEFPKIYSKFLAADINRGDELVEYSIIDIPEGRYDEACKFMITHFIPYEPKLVSRDAKDDIAVAEDYYKRYMYGIKQKVSVACIKTGSEDFIAVNILEVQGRNDSNISFKPQSKTSIDIMEAINYIEDKADLFNRHMVDYYLSGTGLAIDPQYRGKGIATEMIKARTSILHFLNLKLTSTGFSSVAAQKAAVKAGHFCDLSISYEELASKSENWNFLGTETKNYIQMSLKI